MNNGVLRPHTGRFLEAERPEAAMDTVQGRPESGLGQVMVELEIISFVLLHSFQKSNVP